MNTLSIKLILENATSEVNSGSGLSPLHHENVKKM